MVLGAGIIGIASAYWLARLGCKVTVVDRAAGPALETSFANGGQISASHTTPWATPGAPFQVMKWLLDPKAPLRFTPSPDPDQWRWILKWLRECTPGRTRSNTEALLRLSMFSRSQTRHLRQREQIQYDSLQKGILHFFRSEKLLTQAKAFAEHMTQMGGECRPLTRAEVFGIEPALEEGGADILGGIFTPEDESGDVHKFTTALAERCAALGVTFLFQHGAERLTWEQTKGTKRASGILLRDLAETYYQTRHLPCEAVVVALGCWSAPFLKAEGFPIPVYPAKGYSITLPVGPEHNAPTVSLIDDAHKLVYSRLGDRLRAAGAAELVGYDQSIDPVRAAAIFDTVRRTFPSGGDYDALQLWTGLRPSTPSNRPLIGALHKAPGLYLNTGHGTLGWTMGCGSGRLLAEAVAQDRGLDSSGLADLDEEEDQTRLGTLLNSLP